MTAPSLKKNVPHTKAFTLIELMVAISIVAIPIIAIGILLSGASRGWERIYEDAQNPTRQDALAVMASLQNFGRQANVSNYQVYKIEDDTYTIAVPQSGETIASGQAVQFYYWQETFDPDTADNDSLNTENTGTHYALYYLQNDELKVDFGQVVESIGGVSGGQRQTDNILSTQTLARDVDLAQTTRLFSHTVIGGQGNGCINTELFLTDQDGFEIEIKFATMLRSAWPR